MNFVLIEKAISEIQAGRPIIVVDDEKRENEGDIIISAEKITSEQVAFMVRYTSGVICVAMKDEDLNRLRLPLMVSDNTEKQRTAFTVSVDYRYNTTTGISAPDRTETIKSLINPKTTPDDLLRPGHIFPLKYKLGGVLKRAGHTEAGVDLMELAGLHSAAVLSEIVNDNGSMARSKDLEIFAKKHNLLKISIADLVRYRRQKEKLVQSFSSATIPTAFGDFQAHAYISKLDEVQHLALVYGDIKGKENVLVRVHSECLTGDVFGSKRCDCGTQLQSAMRKIAEEGSGVIVYLRGHEGRGIGLKHKLKAYNLQDQGHDTVQANKELGFPNDTREYGIGAQILADLGVTTMRLITNNPAKYSGLKGYNLEIVERIALNAEPTKENLSYLLTKKEKMGHLIDLPQ